MVLVSVWVLLVRRDLFVIVNWLVVVVAVVVIKLFVVRQLLFLTVHLIVVSMINFGLWIRFINFVVLVIVVIIIDFGFRLRFIDFVVLIIIWRCEHLFLFLCFDNILTFTFCTLLIIFFLLSVFFFHFHVIVVVITMRLEPYYIILARPLINFSITFVVTRLILHVLRHAVCLIGYTFLRILCSFEQDLR